jgi:hypothetical protein
MTGPAKRWKDLTPDEKRASKAESREASKARADEYLAKLDAAVADIIANDSSFREYLRISAAMHSYSWGNRLLIAIQAPDARMVAGYERWKELGRPVRKRRPDEKPGSMAVRILAPIVAKVDSDRHPGEKESRVIGFRTVSVFSDRDTEGPPMSPPAVVPLTDDSPEAAKLVDRMRATGEAFGCKIDIRQDPKLGNGSDGRPAGWCTLTDPPEIVVNADLPAAARFKTLTHEIAHGIAGHRDAGDDRQDCEAIAEGAAFVVAAHFGFDTTGYSAPYIAGWSGDVKRVRRLLERIAKLSSRMIDEAESHGGCSACGWDGIVDGGGCEVCR